MKKPFLSENDDFNSFVSENPEYKLQRLSDGSVLVLTGPDIPPQPVPESVTPWQMRKAINASGKRAAVDALLSNPATPRDVLDGWEVATEWKRNDPVLLAMAQQLGMTDTDIDDLFRLAVTL